jgi:hypothetical protein
MNPYVEHPTGWRDFHTHFAPVVVGQLVPQVRPKYVARLELDIYIHELSSNERKLFAGADNTVTLAEVAPVTSGSSVATIEAPAHARIPTLAVRKVKSAFVEIRDKSSREVVCVIELLSPTNKSRTEDRAAYLSKREQLLHSGAHFVEIDLLRGGPRMPMDDLPDCDYYAMVSRVERRPDVDIWPLRLADPLPTIPIPLRSPDPDARLDIAAALNQIYDSAGFEDYIYNDSPRPALEPAEVEWSRRFLPSSAADHR